MSKRFHQFFYKEQTKDKIVKDNNRKGRWLYHDSNSSCDAKMSGRIKFNSDHSSDKLFCRGVPVSRSLFSIFKYLSSLSNLHLWFFNLWPYKIQRTN